MPMRSTIWILLSILIGAAIGLGASSSDLLRMRLSDEQLIAAGLPEVLQDNPRFNPALPHPRVVTDQVSYDFGKMERGSTQSHSFTISNEGDSLLELQKGKTSCKCTLSGLDQNRIRPGESGKVTLEWTASSEEPEFRQTATILTNDPARRSIEFVVNGKIYQQIELKPQGLVVNKLSGETKTLTVRATTVNFDHFEITGHSFQDQATASSYDVSYRPLTAHELNASDTLGQKPVGGVLITVTIKPGLPLGPIRQRILLDTNVPERPQVSLDVVGSIDGDISIVGGRGWNRDQLTLSLGAVSAKESIERDLKILVRGESAGAVEFQVAKVVPEQIQVSLGESTLLSAGRVQQVPLKIVLPRGLPSMSYLGKEHGGFGEIVLSTTHPEFPQLTLKLRFAIGP